jgi:hypothetical protein
MVLMPSTTILLFPEYPWIRCNSELPVQGKPDLSQDRDSCSWRRCWGSVWVSPGGWWLHRDDLVQDASLLLMAPSQPWLADPCLGFGSGYKNCYFLIIPVSQSQYKKGQLTLMLQTTEFGYEKEKRILKKCKSAFCLSFYSKPYD